MTPDQVEEWSRMAACAALTSRSLPDTTVASYPARTRSSASSSAFSRGVAAPQREVGAQVVQRGRQRAGRGALRIGRIGPAQRLGIGARAVGQQQRLARGGARPQAGVEAAAGRRQQHGVEPGLRGVPLAGTGMHQRQVQQCGAGQRRVLQRLCGGQRCLRLAARLRPA